MRRRRSKEGAQSNAIVKMGLAQDITSAEFAEQPDSGSRIGGVRGLQEYGIDGAAADDVSRSDERGATERSRLAADVEAASAGLSEFGEGGEEELLEGEGEADEVAYRDKPRGFMSPGDLGNLLMYRLQHNREIDAHRIQARVEPSGLVTLTGSVRSDAEKLRVEEVALAIPGVTTVTNKLVATYDT